MQHTKRFGSFAEFYPYYLDEHKNRSCRLLHFIGTTLVIVILACGVISGAYTLFVLLPVAGYGFAWMGHFFFEKNRPATFDHPLFSLRADVVMYYEILTGKIRL